MKATYLSLLKAFAVLVAAFLLPCVASAKVVADADGTEAKTFTLVIDAGHGGNDPGAIGKVAKEKTVNLNVALALGKLVEANCPDVKVVYTRKTDVFIALQERANIANRNKADLFISIHTNAVASNKGAVYGAETYTLGMHRAADNLEVAKRENSVITMEADYKTKYQGFDPNKAESYIIFELMQDKHMAKSVKLANAIQKQYASAGRKNKGVHQAGFLVLRQTSMPSVLTELGFISNPTEEAFLNSTDGVNKLARSIYDGFVSYRKQLAYNVEEPAAPAEADAPLMAAAETQSTPPAEVGLLAGQTASAADAYSATSCGTQPQMETAAAAEVTAAAAGVTVAAAGVTVAAAGVTAAAAEVTAAAAGVTVAATESTAAAAAEVSAILSQGATPSPSRPVDDDVVPSIRPVTTTPYPITTRTQKENATPSTADAAQKPAETKAESKPAAQKPAEPTAESKPAAQKPAEPKAENKPAAQKPAEPKAENKPAAQKPAEPKAAAQKAEPKTEPKAETKAEPAAAPAVGKPVFRIQLISCAQPLKEGDARLKGLPADYYMDGTTYKYTYGSSADYNEIVNLKKTIADKFPGVFIVALLDGKRIDLQEGIRLSKQK